MKLLAQVDPIGTVTPPNQISSITGGTGAEGLTTFINLLINLVMVGSAVIFIFMILWGGFQWLTSGGDKEKVKSARSRITHAIIGLAIVALAALIAQFVGSIFGFHIFKASPQCPAGEHPIPGGGCHS